LLVLYAAAQKRRLAMNEPRFRQGDVVVALDEYGLYGEVGVIERILPPSKLPWSSKQHRYLVRLVAEYGGKKHITKFQYKESQLCSTSSAKHPRSGDAS
jgi:hypothetical protein